MAVPLVIPDEIAAKPSKGRKRSEILRIIRSHPSHGKLQEVILQKKTSRKANCKTCKQDIDVGTYCFRVLNAIVAPCNSDKAILRDVSFCKNRTFINNPPPYVYIALPKEIKCTADVPEEKINDVKDYFSVIRS